MISAPLPSPVSPRKPLQISLSLAPLRGSSSSGTNVVAPDPNDDQVLDIFDNIDRLRGDLDLDHDHLSSKHVGPEELPKKPLEDLGTSIADRSDDKGSIAPLLDWTRTLFPGLRLPSRSSGEDARSPSRDGFPDWVKQTSGRVTAMAAVRLDRPAPPPSAAGTPARKRARKRMVKVAVGCEDGSLWLFASPPPHSVPGLEVDSPSPTPSSFRSSTNSNRTKSPPLGRLSLETTVPFPSNSSLPSPSPSSPASNSPPTSPKPLSVRSRNQSNDLNKLPRPPLFSRRTSSASLSVRRMQSTASSAPTVASIDVHSIHTTTSHHHHQNATRPRKASATVSMTTSSTSTLDSSFPLSTTLPSPTLSSHGAGLAIPTSPPTTTSGGGSGTPRPASRHRSRGSITNGIGLWEQESNASLSIVGDRYPELEDQEEATEEEEEGEVNAGDESISEVEDEALNALVPVLRIRMGGGGEIVSLNVVEGTRFGKEEGGSILLALRRSGCLSLHSLVDGREFGSCDLGTNVPSTSRTSAMAFEGLEVLALQDQRPIAICYGSRGIGFVAVDLDSLDPQTPVDSSSGSTTLRPALIFKQGVHFLVFATTSSSHSATSDEGLAAAPRILVAPVRSETPNSSLSGSSAIPAVIVEPAHSIGEMENLNGPILGIRSCDDDLLAFDSSGIEVFTIRDQKLATLGALTLPGIVDISVEGYNAILVSTATELRSYRLEPSADSTKSLFTFTLTSKSPMGGLEQAAPLPLSPANASTSSDFLVARTSRPDCRVLEYVSIAKGTSAAAVMEVLPLFESQMEVNCLPRITKIVQLDRERALLGYSSGAIRDVRFEDFEKPLKGKDRVSLPAAITLLELHTLGKREVVIAGSADGSAASWYLDDWELVAQWRLFASPVCHLAHIDVAKGPLSQTIAFVSANSPIALVSLFPPQLHFILPGTSSAVQSISTSNDDLLIIYAHGLSRVCNIEGLELRRSMDLKTAEGVLSESGWTNWFSLGAQRDKVQPSPTSHDPLLMVDLRHNIDESLRLLPWAEAQRGSHKTVQPPTKTNGSKLDLTSDSQNSRDNMGLVRLLLSQVATFGLDADTDDLLESHLGVSKPMVPLPSAISSGTSLSVPLDPNKSSSPWELSSTSTAQRLLQIVCLLRVFLNFPDTERYASQAIVFYASFLADAVGPSFVPPALELLADYWLDGSTEVQQAAQLLFGSYLGACADDKVIELVERWQDLLPSKLPPEAPPHPSVDQAVLITGLVASEKYKILSSLVLKEISSSITTFLADEDRPYHQAIATELCARGFEIWQNYVDAMPLVRQLFGLATGRTASTPNDLRNMARLATLHVAGVNTPLFMTTLSFDILNAQSASHRNATMKLLGFMVRKKPLVLHTSLPRLAEAVVKSLDPTVTHLREAVQQAATVILNELVRTYPSIDFHGRSQRLAVGTHEGAAIVYDLKTATRLYVLEGHTRAITALSWSPDGRRLVSVSLEESKAVVWKVGVGILSMFNPGAPPRQGSGGTATPFKTLDFAVGDEAYMTTAATLEWVTFEWPAERTTRLKIRETTLTFSV
ncbi:hypothetical protein T439DRAFT_313451 [Meredithblackwellia eburnea MCA 4105]